MLMRNIPNDLEKMVAGVVQGLGYQLWGIELLPKVKSGQLLRIYIDQPQGVNLDNCTAVSRQLGAVLDVEDPIAGEYVLEVSSPGIDRPIFSLPQFAGLCGSRIRVKLKSNVAGRKNYRGDLLAVDGDLIQLKVDGELVGLSFADVDSAHVAADY